MNVKRHQSLPENCDFLFSSVKIEGLVTCLRRSRVFLVILSMAEFSGSPLSFLPVCGDTERKKREKERKRHSVINVALALASTSCPMHSHKMEERRANKSKKRAGMKVKSAVLSRVWAEEDSWKTRQDSPLNASKRRRLRAGRPEAGQEPTKIITIVESKLR